MKISLKDKTTKEIIMFSLLPFGTSTLYTLLGAIGLLLQTIPMFFYQFDEKAQEGKLKAFREEKERREIEELNKLAEQEGIINE